MYVYTFIYVYTSIYILYLYIYPVVPNGKRKPRQFSLIRSAFVHHANGSLTFVRLVTKKQTEVIRLQTDKQTCPSMRDIQHILSLPYYLYDTI
jgi:hypothetical protein